MNFYSWHAGQSVCQTNAGACCGRAGERLASMQKGCGLGAKAAGRPGVSVAFCAARLCWQLIPALGQLVGAAHRTASRAKLLLPGRSWPLATTSMRRQSHEHLGRCVLRPRLGVECFTQAQPAWVNPGTCSDVIGSSCGCGISFANTLTSVQGIQVIAMWQANPFEPLH